MKRQFSFMSTFLCALLAYGSATAGDRSAETVLQELEEFERTGEFQSCLSLRAIRQMKALDERHLLVRMNSGQSYLNELAHRCNDAHRSGYFLQHETTVGKLCQNETIRVVESSSGVTVGACSLGEFELLKTKKSTSE